MADRPTDGSHPGHRHGGHEHGVMTGFVVRPYDLLVGGLLMRRTYADLVELIAVRAPTDGTVLDVGTGPGRLPILLSRRRPDLTVVGVDPSADMLARARRRIDGPVRLRLVEAGAEDLPLADGSVDVVVSSLSSHHWADPAAALGEQSRVLNPGGRLWLVDLRSRLAPDTRARVVRAGLQLLPEPSPLGWVGRRRFTVITAVKPG